MSTPDLEAGPRARGPYRPATDPSGPASDLSIVIVSWNTADDLRRCLSSVQRALIGADDLAGAHGDAAHRRLSAEVIVVDNASEDGSADMVEEEFPEVALVRNPANLGFATGCNVGLSLAAGRHVLLLNPDTIVLGDVLSATVAYLDDHPEVGALGCRVLHPDGTVAPTCFRDPSVLNTVLGVTGLAHLPWPRWLGRERMAGWDRDSERAVDVVTGCYLAVPRTVVDVVGPLDEGYFFCGEESDWCRQIRRAGWAARFAPVGEIVHTSGVAGARIDHRRQLLLDAGLVRYAHANDGAVAGWAMWALRWLFSASRSSGWAVLALLRPGAAARAHARARRGYFARVVRDFAAVRRLAGLRRRQGPRRLSMGSPPALR